MSIQTPFAFKIVRTSHTMMILVSLDWTMGEFLNNVKRIVKNNLNNELRNTREIEIVEAGQLGYRYCEDAEPIKPSNTITFADLYTKSHKKLNTLAFYIRPVYNQVSLTQLPPFSQKCESIYSLFYGDNNIFSGNNDNNNTECPICYESKKKYSMFTCNHSFCAACCVNLIKTNDETNRQHNTNNKVVCPLCRSQLFE